MMGEIFLTMWDSPTFWFLLMATGGVFFLIGAIRFMITMVKDHNAESCVYNAAESCNEMTLGCAAVALAALMQEWWLLSAVAAYWTIFFWKRERTLRMVLRDENAIRRIQKGFDENNPDKPNSQEDEDDDQTDD